MTALPISLPDGFSVSVSIGDSVTAGQTIATKKNSSEEIINIPKELGINPEKARKSLKKVPGEKVSKGDIIAIKKNFLGPQVILRSRVTGTVSRFERDSGNLAIKTGVEDNTENLISPVDGKVVMCDNKEIVIDTDKNVLIGDNATGKRGEGEIYVLQADDSYHLDSLAIGKVAISGSFTREMLSKGIGIGVAGLIGKNISDEDLEYLVRKGFKTPVIRINGEDYKKITQWQERKVFLNPESKSVILLQV